MFEACKTRSASSRYRAVWSGVFFAIMFALAASASAQEPLRIRVSWVAVPNNLPPFMFKKAGVPKHYGKSYTMEAIQYRGTPQSITALATGDLDIALLSYSSFPLAIQNANMQDLRVIADEFQDGADGYFSAEFMVLKDGPIKKIEDIKGKVVAVNVKNGATHGAVRSVLAKHGLQERDYNVIEVAFPNMRAVLAERKVDVISVGTPQFAWDPEVQKIARTLFTQRDAFGKTDVVIWCARQGFLEKNRAAMIDFMEDMLRDRRYLFDPANRSEAIKIVSEFTKIPADKLESWVFTNRDFYRDPNARPDLVALQANVDQLHKEGSIKQALDVRKYTDLSILEEALKRPK
jgi:ABC-type nitrate/sulfonate/bicarbonate transport system substrate-binding protein